MMVCTVALSVDSEPAIKATTILWNEISTNNTHAYINAFEAFKRTEFMHRFHTVQ